MHLVSTAFNGLSKRLPPAASPDQSITKRSLKLTNLEIVCDFGGTPTWPRKGADHHAKLVRRKDQHASTPSVAFSLICYQGGRMPALVLD